MAHVCEFCGDPSHTTVACKGRPKGYVHPYRGSGKGKGATQTDASKGKGKGIPTRRGGGRKGHAMTKAPPSGAKGKQAGGTGKSGTQNSDGSWNP